MVAVLPALLCLLVLASTWIVSMVQSVDLPEHSGATALLAQYLHVMESSYMFSVWSAHIKHAAL